MREEIERRATEVLKRHGLFSLPVDPVVLANREGIKVHNAKFSKSLLQTDEARQALRSVIETYLKRGGFEIQINVVGKEDLLDAQEHPERYPDLLVRVAGYSDYFVLLNKNMQEEIIARTEHGV